MRVLYVETLILKPVNIEIIEIMTFPLDLELRVIK
jgi:hypothetical protein